MGWVWSAVILSLLVCGLLTLTSPLALAEPFIDMYGGFSRTESAQVTVSIREGIFDPTASASRTVEFDPSFILGVRGGYWFERIPWVGLALDLSSFKAVGKDVEIEVIPVSALLMLRWPFLTSNEFPKGRIQPYVGIGAGLVFSRISADFTPDVPRKVDAQGDDSGLDFRSGLGWHFNESVGIFTEYRFTRIASEAREDQPDLCFFCPTRTIKTTFETSHFIAGVSLRF